MTVFIDDLSTDAVDLLKSELVYAKRRIAHLEGLVRLSAAMNACGSGCPFCGAYPKEDDRSVLNHAADCPAFTPDGEIK